MTLTALTTDLLQEAINNDAYRRMTPDSYRTIVNAHYLKWGVDPLEVLDFPSQLDGYECWRMTTVEVLFICRIAGAGAYTLRRQAPGRASRTAFKVIAVVVATSIAYCWFAAPWAMIMDYDTFVSDRILGGLSLTFAMLLFLEVDPVTGITLATYALATAAVVRRWPRPRVARLEPGAEL